jgi:hypothetical protein
MPPSYWLSLSLSTSACHASPKFSRRPGHPTYLLGERLVAGEGLVELVPASFRSVVSMSATCFADLTTSSERFLDIPAASSKESALV